MDFRTVKFPKNGQKDFINTVRKRVGEYFVSNNISRYANFNMVAKSVFMIALYVVPYLLMLTGVISSTWGIFSMWILMGFGILGIGTSIMHDANHGAYSRNKRINTIMGYLMNALGGSATNWKFQHNVLHHSYTNIDGVDEDISPGILLRFSPHQKRFKMHRLQHIYAWFLYSLMTISWTATKDFRQLYRYNKMGLTNHEGRSFRVLLSELIFTKVLYYFFILILPLILLPIPWWMTLLFYVCMHLVSGLFLAMIFQPAHVVPDSEYPIPDEKGNLENSWAIHQLLTTTNFAPSSRFFSWYIGGLNFQIEHHLFPNICHVHYKKISKIVKQTAQEFGLPYHSQPNFAVAVAKHAKMLRDLGRYDMI